jgi:hypothetical protein
LGGWVDGLKSRKIKSWFPDERGIESKAQA